MKIKGFKVILVVFLMVGVLVVCGKDGVSNDSGLGSKEEVLGMLIVVGFIVL